MLENPEVALHRARCARQPAPGSGAVPLRLRYRRNTTPVEAASGVGDPEGRRLGGARAGGFPGAEDIPGELAAGRVGPRRAAAERPHSGPRRCMLFTDDTANEPIGQGYVGRLRPSVDARRSPWDMSSASQASPTHNFSRRSAASAWRSPLRSLPFVTHRYKRSRQGGNAQC